MPNPSKIPVQIDFREYRSKVPYLLAEQENIEVTKTHLDKGDYLIADLVIVERKTLTDLSMSILDGRLFEQSKKLDTSNPKRNILLLEGNSQTLAKNGISREAIQGALIHLTLFKDIAILRSLDEAESAKIIIYIAGQLDKFQNREQPYFKLQSKDKVKKDKKKEKSQRFVLQTIPGIGAAKANLLLEKFGSLEAIFKATEGELMEVEGIGNYTAKQIQWILKEDEGGYFN